MRTTLVPYLKAIVQRSRSSALIKNTTTAVSGQGLNIGVQGLYFVLLARALGPQEYGAYVTILALSRIFAPFSGWGYGNILVKNASRDPAKFRESWGTGLSVAVLGGGVFVVVVLIICKVLLHLGIAVAAILLISFADLVFAQTQTLSQQAYQSFGRLTRFVQIQNGASVLRLLGAGLMLVLVHAPTALVWSWLYFLTGMVPAILGVVLVNRELGHYVLGLRLTRPEVTEGFYFSFALASYTIDNDIDKTLLASLGSLGAAGLYTAAYRFVDVAFIPINGLLISSYPDFFKQGAAGIRGSRNWALKLLPWAAAYGSLAAIALFAMAGLIPFVLGIEYARTPEMLRWLSPLILLKSVEFFIANVLTGSGYQGVRTVIQGAIALVNVALCLWLIPTIGWLGAALASVAADGVGVIAFSMAVIVLARQHGHG